MSHFAKVLDGKVTQVIVAEPEFFQTFVDSSPGEWIQTSYTGSIRGNFAGVGYTYDKTNDVFYAPSPFASWTLNQTTWLWEAPTAYPTDGKKYNWDESTLKWVEEGNTPLPADEGAA